MTQDTKSDKRFSVHGLPSLVYIPDFSNVKRGSPKYNRELRKLIDVINL